eukprot:5559264-Amphidinium_carterae.1
MQINYVGRISTLEILEKFARAKRVGKIHLELQIDMDGGWSSFQADSVHISKNWDNCTMVMTNHSYGKRSKSDSVTPEQYERQHSRLNVLEQERFGGTEDIMMARRESQEAEELL